MSQAAMNQAMGMPTKVNNYLTIDVSGTQPNGGLNLNTTAPSI